MKQPHIYLLSCVPDGGIYHYQYQNGKWEWREKIPLDRPMYAVLRENRLYVLLQEIDATSHFGGVLSFDVGENGALTNPTPIQSSEGLVPCHLEVTKNGIYVVNYDSGNLVKLGRNTVAHRGTGKNPLRQEAPHTHFVGSIPGDLLACADLGVDTIYFYDEELQETDSVRLPGGSGPRHLFFHNHHLYCVTELSNEVFVFQDKKQIGRYSTVPGFSGESYAAAIRIHGDFLYVSNRGANTISRFHIQGDRLVFLESTDCCGLWPWDFDIVGETLICANEKSNSVTVFSLREGKPVPTGESLSIERPLCVVIREEP